MDGGQGAGSGSGLPVLLFFVVPVLVVAVFIRYPRLWTALKAFLAVIGLKRKLDKETLDEIVGFAGYSYDEKQDLFFSNIDAWQRQMGYCRLYDEAQPLTGMILDCEPVEFVYDGKRWLIEFWKGQYDLCMGCEIGIYSTDRFDVHIPGFFEGPFYDCVGDADLLPMSFTLYKNGKWLFEREDTHWWLTGFLLGGFSDPYDLTMDISITLKDRVMRTAFVEGLRRIGYGSNEIRVDGKTVKFRFDKPRTPQPPTRIPETDEAVQWKNELMCRKYRDIARPYSTLLDKVNAVLGHAPELRRELFNIGKNRGLRLEYKKIRKQERDTAGKYAHEYLSRVFASAPEILFDNSSRIALMSDVHRGDGSWADGFSSNRVLYLAALNHYFDNDFTYIEIGDGDELWENVNFSDIVNVHRDVFHTLRQFHEQGRLYVIFGNHDMVKQDFGFVVDNMHQFFDEREREYAPLFEGLRCHEGLVLKHGISGDKVFLVHGHQVDRFNYNFWRLARFLARHLWKPLELLGVKDLNSPARNYQRKAWIEKRFTRWVMTENQILITGHTHRPTFPAVGDPPYFNGGSSLHPQGITGLEIERGRITLVKWLMSVEKNGRMFAGREVLAGPTRLADYYDRSRFPVGF